jgi:poly(A) polymerase
MTADALRSLLGDPLGKRIHDVLKTHGGEVRLVGGAVRDAVSGQIADHLDLDMAMTMKPEEATEVLAKNGLHVIPTGLEHGTITVLEKKGGEQKIELTTLRIDVSTDGRHADVAFTENWTEDAKRRDFTINALYLGYDGNLFDPVGGCDDLKKGRVRFIGKAEDRIREDYLRMLRFFRFNARFAKSKPDQEAMAGITRHAESLSGISGERIAREFDQLIMLGPEALKPMAETGLDRYLTEPGFNLDRYADFLKLFKGPGNPSLAGRYAALTGVDQVEEFAERLKMSNAMRMTMHYVAGAIEGVKLWDDQNWSRKAWRYLQHRNKKWWHPRYLAERFVLAAQSDGFIPPEAVINNLMSWSPPEFPVSGQDLIELGFGSGEKIGAILTGLEEIWVESGFSTSKDELFSMIEGLDMDSTQGERFGKG